MTIKMQLICTRCEKFATDEVVYHQKDITNVLPDGWGFVLGKIGRWAATAGGNIVLCPKCLVGYKHLDDRGSHGQLAIALLEKSKQLYEQGINAYLDGATIEDVANMFGLPNWRP